MKVWVYELDNRGGIYFYLNKLAKTRSCFSLIGTLDLDIQTEKKWVKKVADVWFRNTTSTGDKECTQIIPFTARNVTLHYEVEE